jgi:predicted nucleic acid-binding protein
MSIVPKKQIRVYVDTSVFGGVFDDEFARASKQFFNEVQENRFVLITSEGVREEILEAPQRVQDYFEKMLSYCETVEIGADAYALQEAYLKEGIVSEKYAADALHVALATVSNARMIVSWNFKHIVNFQKIPLYNAVNQLNGYDPIDIYSPLEVIDNEDEEKEI